MNGNPKYSALLIWGLCLVSFQQALAVDFPLVYEAEEAAYESLKLRSDTKASGGEYLQMRKSGKVVWNIVMSDAGWYNLKFRYRSPRGEKENFVIQNGVKRPIGFGWAVTWTETARPLALKAGTNTIELASNWGWIDIDCLMIDTVVLTPEITPHKNVFYTKFPRDIFVKVNAYGRSIQSVTANGSPLLFDMNPYEFEEDARMVRIDGQSLAALPEGEHAISIDFDTDESVTFQLRVMTGRAAADLTIIAPDVSHGNSVLFLLPNGKTMLVDCGQAFIRDGVIIPLLEQNGISHLDYFILTHYHDDHDSGDKGATIRDRFKVENFRDYRDFNAGEELEIGGVQIKILNAYADGTDENTRSLAFQLKYKGFVYRHDADIYADNQRSIMRRFPDDVRADVYFANHHFHGSSDADYLRATDPTVVLIQAEQVLYARSTYTTTYLLETVKWLQDNEAKTVENLPAIEVGTTVIRVNSVDDWNYETYKNSETPLIPFLPKR